METIQVTINPDGTAKEVNFRGDKPINPENYRGSTFYLAYVQMQKDWHIAERALRTFEIEREPCTCKTPREVGHCKTEWCDLTVSMAKGYEYTAEILENGKVRLIN